MNNRIDRTVEKFNMLSKGDRVLAAVSGGADSMLMLHYLIDASKRLNLSLCVAHVEHGIRGKESEEDAEFVRDFCAKNSVEFHQLSINAVSEAEKFKMGIEEYSRKRRYEFFESIPCDKIATAHNLSDSIETVLFRLGRGTGLKGVCGIPAVRGKIIRPLIEISSDEIRKYCRENSIEYRNDSTNASDEYSRNYIRNVIIPGFVKLNSAFESNMKSFIESANEDNYFIENAVNSAFGKTVSNNRILLNELRKYDAAAAKRIIKKYFYENGIETDKFHLDEIVMLMNKCGKVQIKSNYFAVSDKNYLRIADFSKRINNFSFVSKVLNISEFNQFSVDFYCDCDKIVGNVTVKSRNPGDTIRPAGRNCTKTLKKLFNELKIPQEERESVAVIYDDAGVIGVAGYCADERVSVDDTTKNILSIKLSAED